MPIAYRSERALTAWPWACSGDRYCAVPMIEPVSVMSDAPARAIPKSVTFARPSSSMITLCGLMSRWITPRRWAKRAALRICWSMTVSGAMSRISGSPRDPPSVDQRLHHLLGDRRGHLSAGPVSALVRHGHGDLRVVDRGEGDEPRLVAGALVLLGRAGLARDL